MKTVSSEAQQASRISDDEKWQLDLFIHRKLSCWAALGFWNWRWQRRGRIVPPKGAMLLLKNSHLVRFGSLIFVLYTWMNHSQTRCKWTSFTRSTVRTSCSPHFNSKIPFISVFPTVVWTFRLAQQKSPFGLQAKYLSSTFSTVFKNIIEETCSKFVRCRTNWNPWTTGQRARRFDQLCCRNYFPRVSKSYLWHIRDFVASEECEQTCRYYFVDASPLQHNVVNSNSSMILRIAIGPIRLLGRERKRRMVCGAVIFRAASTLLNPSKSEKTSFRQSPNEIRQLLDSCGQKLGIKDPYDWHFVSPTDFSAVGGTQQFIISFYIYLVRVAWKTMHSLFSATLCLISHFYLKNVRFFVIFHLVFSKMAHLVCAAGLAAFQLHFQGSLYEALRRAYPEHEWYRWLFANVPPGFWEKTKHRRQLFEWVGRKQLKLTKWVDWYSITRTKFCKAGGATLFSSLPAGANFPTLWWKFSRNILGNLGDLSGTIRVNSYQNLQHLQLCAQFFFCFFFFFGLRFWPTLFFKKNAACAGLVLLRWTRVEYYVKGAVAHR